MWGFADSTLVVTEGQGGLVLLREQEGARGLGHVEPPVKFGC